MKAEQYYEEISEPYKCGHKGEPVLINSNPMSIASYLEWRDTQGYAGDRSACWNCWCEKIKQNWEKHHAMIKLSSDKYLYYNASRNAVVHIVEVGYQASLCKKTVITAEYNTVLKEIPISNEKPQCEECRKEYESRLFKK